MSKTEVIDKLFSEISDQRAMYGWTVGIFITLFIAFIGVQWFVNTRQAKKIERDVLRKINTTYQNKINILINGTIENIKNKLDYMSKLDNSNEDEAKFIAYSIRNDVSTIFSLSANDELNKYLNKIVFDIDEATDSLNKLDNSNDVVWEGFRMIRKGIVNTIQYKKLDEEPK